MVNVLNHQLKFFCLVLISVFIMGLIGSSQGMAQSGVHSSGGQAGGAEGTVDFSIGQVFYHYAEDETGSVANGVQVPFELLITSLSEVIHLSDASVFPNPTTGNVQIEMLSEVSGFHYRLYNINGQLVMNGEVSGMRGQLQADNLTAGVYFLNLIIEDTVEQSFKIIKK